MKTVTPGASYRAGWLHRMFFGDHWRNLWVTPVEVEVLDLSTFAGGLKPLKRGGGMQTQSLRFAGADGKQYKFRSIDKNPERILPEKLRATIAKDILQDQISSANPLSSLVAASVLNGVGLLNAEPRLVVLPDDPRLGDFYEDFRGMLGTIEEHPDEGPESDISFAGADKIISTYTLFEKMEKDHRHRVDEHEYLKARLIDILLGDWDRHTDQWRWAGFEHNGWWIWRPIPRDRDQAFARFDGVLPWIADVVIPMLGLETVAQLSHFGDEYPSIEDLTWTGRFLDRRLLNSLTRADWDSVTTWLQATLSDSLIETAVHKLPAASFEAGGHELLQSLKSRRNGLSSASKEFYRLIAVSPDLRGSDKDEYVHIRRLDDSRVEVSLFERVKKDGTKRGDPLFHRMFDAGVTNEIRLSLLGGDDYAVVTGDVGGSIPLYIEGGRGSDELHDSSHVDRSFLHFVPFVSGPTTATVFYIDRDDPPPVLGNATKVKEHVQVRPRDELERWEPSLRDYGTTWRIGTWFGASPDDGLFLGGGPVWTRFGFHEDPFVSRIDLRIGYATRTGKYRAEFTVEFPISEKGAQYVLHVKGSQLEVINYFGFGNETEYGRELVRAGYFKVRQQQFLLQQALEWPVSSSLRLRVGGSLKYVDTDLNPFTLLAQQRPYGSTLNLSLVSIDASLNYDSRDSRLVPSEGWLGEVGASYVRPLINDREHFARLRADTRAYVRLPVVAGSVWAMRIAGERLLGDIPFFEAAYLGGAETVRGFEKQRFAGNAMLLGNTEFRLQIKEFMFVVPITFGVSAFGESGRVIVDHERSSQWHSSFGGGVWFSFVDPEASLSLSVARSGEEVGVYFRTGFMF